MNGRDAHPVTDEASISCEVARRDGLIAVSGQADLDSCGQVAHPADAQAQVVAVVGRIRERLERVGADLSDLAKLVVFHVPALGCAEWEVRDLLARALGPDALTTLTMVPLPRLVSPGILIAVDAYAMRGAPGRRIERAPLGVPRLASLPEPFCHGLRCEEFIVDIPQRADARRGAAAHVHVMGEEACAAGTPMRCRRRNRSCDFRPERCRDESRKMPHVRGRNDQTRPVQGCGLPGQDHVAVKRGIRYGRATSLKFRLNFESMHESARCFSG